VGKTLSRDAQLRPKAAKLAYQ